MNIDVSGIKLADRKPTGTVSTDGHAMKIAWNGASGMKTVQISCSCFFIAWDTGIGFEPVLDRTHRELYNSAARRAQELCAEQWGRDC